MALSSCILISTGQDWLHHCLGVLNNCLFLSRCEGPCEGTNSTERFITPGYFDNHIGNPKLSTFYVMDVGRLMVMAVMCMCEI